MVYPYSPKLATHQGKSLRLFKHRTPRHATSSSEGKRRNDLLRDKQNIVSAFFEYIINKNPAEVRPVDVRDWLSALESRGMRSATIYQRASLLSSFYA